MTTNRWTFEYKDEPWSNISPFGKGEGKGFYTIKVGDTPYGFLTKDAWKDQNTGEILALVIGMLNDAHDMALTFKGD